MSQDVLLILAPDVLVVDWLSRFTVDPSNIKRSIWQASIEMLDEAHDPGHLNAPFDRELASRFHFPTRSRTAPRANLTEAGDDDNLVEINETPKLSKIAE